MNNNKWQSSRYCFTIYLHKI